MTDTTTPILQITQLQGSQSQPEVPVNEAIRILEAFAGVWIVVAKNATSPPSPASDGELYLVADGGTGEWAAKDGQGALMIGGAWIFRAPRNGQLLFCQLDDAYFRFSSLGSPIAGWIAFP